MDYTIGGDKLTFFGQQNETIHKITTVDIYLNDAKSVNSINISLDIYEITYKEDVMGARYRDDTILNDTSIYRNLTATLSNIENVVYIGNFSKGYISTSTDKIFNITSDTTLVIEWSFIIPENDTEYTLSGDIYLEEQLGFKIL